MVDPVQCTVRIWPLVDGAYGESGRIDLLGLTAAHVAAELDWA